MRTIYRVIPVPVFETDRFIPDRFSALSLGIVILIRPRSRGNEALIQHELTHCRQFYRTLGLHAPLYWLSDDWRYKSELEAWRVQVGIDPGARPMAIRMLVHGYGLDVSQERADREL